MKPLDEIDIIIDTREKDARRIDNVARFFDEKGAYVCKHALKTCDYHITGRFNGVDVDLGIEFKTGSDYAGSYKGLNDRLARAVEQYKSVGLLVQHTHNELSDGPDGNPNYTYNLKDGLTLHCNFFTLQNALRTFAREGIYVAQAWSSYEVPRLMVAFLYDVTSYNHHGLCFKDKYDNRNCLLKLPGVGVITANKLIERYGTIYNIMTAPASDIKTVLGKKNGAKFIKYIGREDFDDA